jgi:hypothetical protein
MYRCIRKCYHRKRLYHPGQEYTPTADEIKDKNVPRHFVLNEQYSVKAVIQAEQEEKLKRIRVKAEKSEKTE